MPWPSYRPRTNRAVQQKGLSGRGDAADRCWRSSNRDPGTGHATPAPMLATPEMARAHGPTRVRQVGTESAFRPRFGSEMPPPEAPHANRSSRRPAPA